MGENSWALKGLDPAILDRAAAAAARRGVSLADYITGMLLQRMAAPAPRQDEEAVAPRAGPIGALFNNAIRTIDAFACGLAAKADGAEALANDTARALARALERLETNTQVLLGHLAEAEANAETRGEANDAALAELGASHGELARRLADIDETARAAGYACAALASAQEAFRQAAAEDFSLFAQTTMVRLSGDLDKVHAAAEAASIQADAAMAHVAGEMGRLREAIEARLSQDGADTHARLQAGLAQSAAGVEVLAERIGAGEHAAARTSEHLDGRIGEVETGARRALDAVSSEVGALRETIDVRLSQSAADALACLRAGLTESAAGVEALAERVGAGERAAARTSEHLDGRIGEVEAGAREALAQTQSMLAGELASAQTHGRQALGALGAELAEARAVLGQSVGDRAAEARENLAAARADAAQRFDALAAGVEDVRQDAARAGARTHAALEHAADERRAELEKLNLALSAQVETVRDGLARVETGTQTAFEQAAEALNQSRSAFGAELGELRGALDRRIDVCTADARDNLAAAQAAATQRLDALGASVAATRQDMAQAESHTQAGLEHAGSGLKELRDALDRRVGACAAEAGEKIAAAQAASAQLAHALDGRVEDMRKDATQAETRAQAALERAALTHDAALAKLHDSLDRRIDETAAQTGKALAAAQANASERVDAVAARVEDVCKNLAQSEARTQAALECSTVERRVELGALSETLAARVESVRQGVAQSEANTRIALERAAAEQGGALGKLREELGQRIGASAAAQAVAAKRADTLAAHLDDTRQGVARIEAGAKGAAAHAGAAQAASARQLAALAARVEDLAQAEPRLRTAFECAGAEHRAEFLELRKSAAAQSETASQAQAQAEDRAQTALERAAIEQRGELGKLSLALSTRVESVRDGLAEAEVRTQAALEQASAAHDAALSALRQEFGQSTHAYAAERATLGAAQAASAHRIEKLAARAEDLAQAEMRTQAALEQAAAEHGAEMGALRAALTKDVGQSLEAIEARTQAALAGAAAEQSGALQLVDALAARVDDAAQVERHAAARHAELTELHAALVQTSRTARVSAKKNRHQLAAAMTELRAEQAGAAARLQGDMDRLSAQISAQIRIADDSAIPARLDGLHSRLDARDTQTEAIAASLEQRFAGLERRQAEALEAMHAGLAQIFNETEARFGTLERALAEPGANEDGYDSQRIAVEFETLRQRIEDRILEVEKRSVRALEGVGETIALIAKKFNQPARPDDETDAPAAERA